MSDTLTEIADHIRLAYESAAPPRSDLQELRKKLQRLLQANVDLEPAEEYVYSDSLVTYFRADGEPTESERADEDKESVWAAHARISHVHPYATVDWKVTADGKTWVGLKPEELHPALEALTNKIRRFLDEQGYQVLTGGLLDEIIPDQLTGMDDSPATVFQALFSEIG